MCKGKGKASKIYVVYNLQNKGATYIYLSYCFTTYAKYLCDRIKIPTQGHFQKDQIAFGS